MNQKKCNLTGAIVLNGEKYNGIITADIIVAVDGGYENTASSDVFVGDCDSVSSNIACKEKILLNVEKDYTDGEVAVKYLLDKNINHINFYGVNGGRIDHILMNLSLLAMCVSNGANAVAYCNDCDIYMVKDKIEITTVKNSIISLVPFTEIVHIISLEGVKWPLFNEKINKLSSKTISNVALDDKVSLSVASGMVMVIVNK